MTEGHDKAVAALPTSAQRLAEWEAKQPAWLRRLRASRWSWLEPWYDWGAYALYHPVTENDGEGRHLTIDWLGIHLTLVIGRTPKAVRS